MITYILKQKINGEFVPFYMDCGHPTKIPILVSLDELNLDGSPFTWDKEKWIEELKSTNPMINTEIDLHETNAYPIIKISVNGQSLVGTTDVKEINIPTHHCYISIDESLGLSVEEWIAEYNRLHPEYNHPEQQIFVHI